MIILFADYQVRIAYNEHVLQKVVYDLYKVMEDWNYKTQNMY